MQLSARCLQIHHGGWWRGGFRQGLGLNLLLSSNAEGSWYQAGSEGIENSMETTRENLGEI